MNAVTVDLAAAKDLPACAKIIVDIYNNNILKQGWTQKAAERICKFYYHLQPDLLFVAKRENDVVGFTFGYVKPWADGNWLMVEEISINKNNRNGGTAIKLAETLLKTAISKYKVTKVNGVTWEDEENMPYKLYKWLGFKRMDEFLVQFDAKKLLNKIERFV